MKIKQMMATLMVMLMVLALPVNVLGAETLNVVNEDTQTQANNQPNYLAVTKVELNDDEKQPGERVRTNKGDNLDVTVKVKAGDLPVEDAEIEVSLGGYRYAEYERDDIVDYSGTFDLKINETEVFDMSLKIPIDYDKDNAALRIRVTDRNNPSIEYLYTVSVNGVEKENAIQIQDFFISPSQKIEAGRALSFKVKVENMGDRDYDDVSVKISMPELGLNVYETIDEIEVDDTQSFEALILRIPTETQPGVYDVVATVDFDKYQDVSTTKTVEVISREDTEEQKEEERKTTVTMPQSLELTKETTGSVYPIMISNEGDAAKTYVVSVSGVDEWATTTLEPSSVIVVAPGESKTVYLNMQAKEDASVGDKVFQVTINSGTEVSTTSVVASVKGEDKTTGVRSVLEWALVILVIILIILGIVILVSRMRKGDKEDDDESQTYY